MKQVCLALFGFLLCIPLAYGKDDYRCTVERIVASGWPATTQTYQESIYLGKQFTVERNTGLMAGILKNSNISKPQVIDQGSKDNSFKVVTTLRKSEGIGAGSNIYVLTVKEYETSPKKPFVFLENDVVYTGLCEHF